MRALSVRAKLTVWYSLVTFVGLLLFGSLTFAALRFALFQGKKSHLRGRELRLLRYLEENKAQQISLPLVEQLRNYATITHEGNLFELRDSAGNLLFPLDPVKGVNITPRAESCEKTIFFLQKLEHTPAMVMCHQIVLNGKDVQLYLGGMLDEELYMLDIYRNALLLLTPVLISLAAASGYLLSRQALSSVDRMTRAATSIGIRNLSARLPIPPAKDEIQHLAVAWNQLLSRLETAVSHLSKFSADVSHDLRTSITVILAIAQLSLHRHHSEAEYREDLGKIVTECRTASTLLDALLSLARSETFGYEISFRRIDLCALAVNGCRRVEDLAESSGIVLDWSLPENSIYIDGDDVLLQRLLGILLDNAIKFTPEYGQVSTEVSCSPEGVSLIVRDTGIGMTNEVQSRVFERFYHTDFRERKSQAGNGLGLSIARWIADAHHAEIRIESVPNRGSVFQVKFPRSMVAISSLDEIQLASSNQ